MQKIKLFYTALSEINDQKTKINSSIETISNSNPFSGEGLKSIIDKVKEEYFIIYTRPNLPKPGKFSIERMVQVAKDTKSGILYSDFIEIKNETKSMHPLIDYQPGSIRDDFDFGPLLLINSKAAKESIDKISNNLDSAALYDLRLGISLKNPIIHLNEYLYTIEEKTSLSNEEKQFAYVDPKNRKVQIEMEEICTKYLKNIGAWLSPDFKELNLSEDAFSVEASVIIPVRNRSKTILDAIKSVLNQKTKFEFNLIIIDNHSTDGTTEIISSVAEKDSRIVHIIPKRDDLGIGGCWNEGVHHKSCGRFSVQLDSDDVYSNENTLEKIVTGFYNQNCAMLVGSYRMCNFILETIPPGIIDHKEWTPENGRNNALRINGLGAPRAFFTPLLREIKVPNTSYGEDYALGLQFSRRWKIGRIYDVLYLCRRWEDNSDASLDIAKINQYNAYKDKLRSIEISARQTINQKQ